MVGAVLQELTAVCMGGPRAELGETPRFDATTGELLWTDITGGKVHFGTIAGTSIAQWRSLDVAGMAGPVAPLTETDAGWVMARESELVHLQRNGIVTVLASPEAGRSTSFNDGIADPAGNLWVGSMGRDGVTDAGRLWRFDTAGQGTVALDGIGISNGLDFTADGRTAYFIDTTSRVLRRLAIDPSKGITGTMDLVSFPAGAGDPDGLTLDDDGCIWVALWDGWAVHRYSPEGELLTVVHVPVARPTAIALAGDLLVITSCSGWLEEGWEDTQPDAGKLFCVQVDTGGPSVRPYRGPLSISWTTGVNPMIDVLMIGETMSAIAPTTPQPLELATNFSLAAAGAESNVAQYLSDWGHSVAWASKVGNDPLGRRLTQSLSDCGINTSWVVVDPDAPTGVMFKNPGAESTSVHYYRKHSAAASMGPDMVSKLPWSRIRMLHLSGITPALSPTCAELVNALFERASHEDIPVSFDVNFRSGLWPVDSAAPALLVLARAASVVFVGLDEAQTLWPGLETADDVRKLLGDTGRLIVKDGAVGATEYEAALSTFAPTPPVKVVEAVGAGDAFAAGWISALLEGATAPGRLARGHQFAARALSSTNDFRGTPGKGEKL